MITGKNLLAILIYCSLHLSCIAQVRSVYSFQQDDTILKKGYYTQSLKKKDLLLSSVPKQYASDFKQIYEDRLTEVGSVLNSTRAVTSLQAHQYLQSIVQKILAVNKDLANTDARVVFSRDWWPNAYSMGEGTIVINAGLLIYLEDEAELVFVICHELAHYQLDHGEKAIRKYVETVNSEAYQSELKRLSKEEFRKNEQVEKLARSVTFGTRKHSRENEAEADRQAFRYMKQTGYDCDAIKSCLQLLDKIDDSVLLQPLDIKKEFDFPGYPFKQKWIQKETGIFSQLKEDDSPLSKKEKDSLKTHPGCMVRIALLEDSLQAITSTGKQRFLVNENLFRQLKNNFFVEITEENYREENLGRNLYYSLLLLQSGRDTAFAVYSVVRCLNSVYENQKAHKVGMMIDTERKGYSEDYNVLLRLLSRVRLEEVAAINTNFCNRYQSVMNGYAVFNEEMNKAKSKTPL